LQSSRDTAGPLPTRPGELRGWPWTGTVHSAADPAWPRVTIVTPSFNQGSFIEETIRSVVGQGYPNLEYIVMDGGSADQTLDILDRYSPWIAKCESRPDNGQADAINRGWTMATGEYLGWLNSDDLLMPGSIAAAVELMESRPDVGLVYGDIDHIDSNSAFLSLERFDEYDPVAAVREVRWIPQPGSLARRSALEAAGMLDPELHFLMDFDLMLRMGLRSRLHHLDRVQARFRRHENAKTTAQSAVAASEIVRVYDRLFSSADLPASIANSRQRALASAHRYAAEALHCAADPTGAWRQMLLAISKDPGIVLQPRVAGLAGRLLAASVLPGGRDSAIFRKLRRAIR
jgi:GT2 family glycosyltransferase